MTIDRELPPVDVVDVGSPTVDVQPPVCEGTGPILSIQRVNLQATESCAGQLAAHTFTHAICACDDLSAKALSTASFDSSELPPNNAVVVAGAPAGMGGNYIQLSSSVPDTPTDSPTMIGGSMSVAGTARTAVTTRPVDIQGDLRLAGNASFGSRLTVSRDFWLVSRVGYLAFVSVGRTLYRAPGGSLIGFIPPFISNGVTDKVFTIDDPCRCQERLDVAAMETTGSMKVDNAARGIAPSALANISGMTRLELPCGRFRFDSVGGNGTVQLVIRGKTAIFVDAGVDLAAIDLQMTFEPDAELDWFIHDNLVLGMKLGDVARPSALRVYVGGSTEIAVSAASSFSANLYAPNAGITVIAPAILGSVFGKTVTVPEWTSVRYDRSILKQGNKCEQPATCDKCNSCNGGSACMNGTCGPCVADDDCCVPLVCTQGSCQPLLR